MALSFSDVNIPAWDSSPPGSAEMIIGITRLLDERTPSFKVNTKLNVWYDHGSGEGGTLIDPGAKLHQCSLHDFLDKLSVGNYAAAGFPFHRNIF